MNAADEIALNERVTKLEVLADVTIQTLDRLERRMDMGFQESRADTVRTAERLERRMDTGFQELWSDNKVLRGEFQALRTHVDNTFRWLIGTHIMTTLAVLGMMARSAKLF